jgi:ABC-2 type transport system permease protein
MRTLTGTGALVKLALRRDRVMLAGWIYGLTAFVAATVYGFKKIYPGGVGITIFAATASTNSAFLALYGPMYGISLGSLVAWRDTTIGAVFAGLMSIFLMVRHTRADEENGRLELLGSAPVGRHAAIASALVITSGANLVVGVAMTAVAVALGLPLTGTLAMVAAIIGCGLVFTAVAAVTAQVASTARAARGLAIGLLVGFYLVRAFGDAAGPQWISWLSPMGWAEQIQAFTAIRWWVLALLLATALALTLVAAVLAVRRDYDAGLLPQRPGAPQAAPSLRTPLALAWRLQRGALAAWVVLALVFGGVFGAAAKGIQSLARSSGAMRNAVTQLGGTSHFTDAFFVLVMTMVGLFAAGYAISTVLRLHSEETEGRAEPVLVTGAGRTAWGLSHLAIAWVGTVLFVTVTGLAATAGYVGTAGGGGTEVGRIVGAALVQAPAALVLAGLATALFGLAPKTTVGGAWSALSVVVFVFLVGTLLKLSHWFLDISPFTHVPKFPGSSVSPVPLVLLSVVAVLLTAAGLAGLRRRDIG